jgi:hypothetical protein
MSRQGLAEFCAAVDVGDQRQTWIAGITVVILALMVRLFVVFAAPFLEWHTPDTFSYFIQARALLDGGYVGYFPNGYPLLVAMVWSVPGWEGSHVPLQVLSVFFSTATVGLVFYLVFHWKRNWTVAAAAALIIALWPNHVRYVPRLLSDLPAAFFLISSIACLVSKRWLICGLLVGIAVIMRPSFLPIWLGLCAFTLCQNSKKSAVQVFLGGALPIAAIMGLAYLRSGHVSLGRNMGYNLLKSVGIYREDFHFFQRPPPPDASWQGLEGYLGVLVDKPIVFLNQRLHALWDLWGPWVGGEGRSWVSRFVVGWRLPLLLLGLGGLAKNRREPMAWLFAFPVICLTGVHVLFFGHPRFILPVEPLLVVLASVGFWEFVRPAKPLE